MVNTVGELGSRPSHSALAEAYRDSFREAFGAALGQAAAHGEVEPEGVGPRARLLAALTMGVFLSARIDPTDAAEVCESVAAELSAWRLG